MDFQKTSYVKYMDFTIQIHEYKSEVIATEHLFTSIVEAANDKRKLLTFCLHVIRKSTGSHIGFKYAPHCGQVHVALGYNLLGSPSSYLEWSNLHAKYNRWWQKLSQRLQPRHTQKQSSSWKSWHSPRPTKVRQVVITANSSFI